MMASRLIGPGPVDRIGVVAREVHLGRALLTLVVGVFWLLGWLAGKATLGVAFAYAAVRVGFTDARGTTTAEAGSRGRAT